MSDKKLFSQFYSTDLTRYEDKPKFRNRLLKYLEDFINSEVKSVSVDIYTNCRHKMGLDIKRDISSWGIQYCVERTFSEASAFIRDILDFITVIYDSCVSDINSQRKLKNFIIEINRIFQEESMCYVLHDNGSVRFYPDEEFHQIVKCTLAVLSKQKYASNLLTFNEVLDDLYKNHSKESPIHEFFKCVETFALSLLSDGSCKILNDSSVDKLMNKLDGYFGSDILYAVHDKEAVVNIRSIFIKWVGMCHKYRHGKADQINNDVPPELFNFIFSTGITIFRFLLEIDDKYNIKT
ncbi:MAG: hypothetical protein V4496_07245 [Pseudomonadota bacterium]